MFSLACWVTLERVTVSFSGSKFMHLSNMLDDLSVFFQFSHLCLHTYSNQLKVHKKYKCTKLMKKHVYKEPFGRHWVSLPLLFGRSGEEGDSYS